VCLLGIGICGWRGCARSASFPKTRRRTTIKEFNFAKGLLGGHFAGIMRRFMAIGVDQGGPLGDAAVAAGTPDVLRNSAAWVVRVRRWLHDELPVVRLPQHPPSGAGRDYLNRKTPLANNYLFSGLAGTTWYCQFLLYGNGHDLHGAVRVLELDDPHGFPSLCSATSGA